MTEATAWPGSIPAPVASCESGGGKGEGDAEEGPKGRKQGAARARWKLLREVSRYFTFPQGPFLPRVPQSLLIYA